MIIDQISALVYSGESETLELKATTGTRREATMTVCAFPNQRGGHVLFGVTQAGAGQQASERTVSERLWCKRYIPLTAAARYPERIAGRKVTPP